MSETTKFVKHNLPVSQFVKGKDVRQLHNQRSESSVSLCKVANHNHNLNRPLKIDEVGEVEHCEVKIEDRPHNHQNYQK